MIFPLFRRSIVVVLVAFFASPIAGETPNRSVLDDWLARQADIDTWSAQVTQTRKLKAIVRPLETAGEVWFARPNRFRWQLGDPPRTVAVRTENELMLLYPRLRQAERYAARGDLDASWKQALDLLEVGLPSDPEAFHARYELLAATAIDSAWRFELKPAASAALQLIEEIRLEISEQELTLVATELVFPDGSSLRNDFHNHQLNPELDAALFEVELGDDYQVVDPLAKR